MHTHSLRSTKSKVFYAKLNNTRQYRSWLTNAGVDLWDKIDPPMEEVSFKTFSYTQHYRFWSLMCEWYNYITWWEHCDFEFLKLPKFHFTIKMIFRISSTCWIRMFKNCFILYEYIYISPLESKTVYNGTVCFCPIYRVYGIEMRSHCSWRALLRTLELVRAHSNTIIM